RVFTGADRQNPYPYVPGAYYWGIVEGAASSLAAIAVSGNEIMGFVQIGDQHFTLDLLEGDLSGTHILYEVGDLKVAGGFDCFVDDSHLMGDQNIEIHPQRQLSLNCVKMYVEVDYDIYVQKGGVQQTADYVNGAFSQVAILYANEDIDFAVNELVVWNVPDPYSGPTTSNYLSQFRNHLDGNFNGDLAHLVGYEGGGGIAYVNVLCDPEYGVGYSAVNSGYANVPTYSWTVEVLTHEIGHNLGSRHTHA